MTTKLVGLKEFRQNLSAYTTQVQKKQIRIIVLKKNKPVLEINAIDPKEFGIEQLKKDIAEARKQVKEGKVYTHEQIKKELGIP